MATPLPVVISNQGGRERRFLRALGTQPGLPHLPLLPPQPPPQPRHLHPSTATMSILSLPQETQKIPLILGAVEWNGPRHELCSQADLDLNRGSATSQHYGHR